MKEQNVAKSYARALFQLGKEQNVDVASELTKLTEVINQSNQLENLLFLDIFNAEEKSDVLAKIYQKLQTSKLTSTFVNFLIEEERISLLPLIFKDIIVIDDHQKGFLRGTIEGNEDSIPSEVKAKLTSFIESKIGKKAELNYSQNSNISAGYRVTVEDLQLDASVENQLNKLKEQVLND